MESGKSSNGAGNLMSTRKGKISGWSTRLFALSSRLNALLLHGFRPGRAELTAVGANPATIVSG